MTAIAGHIGYDICVMSLAQPGLTDDHLAISMINVPEKSLILFEDIDCLFYDRAQQNTTAAEIKQKGGVSSVRENQHNYMSFSGFLNALDGVHAGEERIIFMTTNYVKQLDKALIRPGRIDMMQYFGYATKHQIEQMFYRFYPEVLKEGMEGYKERITVFVDVLENKGISMAELQEYFLLHKDDIETALSDVQVFVDTLMSSPRRKESENIANVSVSNMTSGDFLEGIQNMTNNNDPTQYKEL